MPPCPPGEALSRALKSVIWKAVTGAALDEIVREDCSEGVTLKKEEARGKSPLATGHE